MLSLCLLFVLACTLQGVFGQNCACNPNANSLQCTLDETQRYAGNTTISPQLWSLCNPTAFEGTLAINLLAQPGNQSIALCNSSSLVIGGDLVVPDSQGTQTVNVVRGVEGDGTMAQNTSLVIAGSLIINDNFEVAVDSITINGDLIVNKGTVSISCLTGLVKGQVVVADTLTLQGNTILSLPATFTIEGSYGGPASSINVSAFSLIIQGDMTAQTLGIVGLSNTFVSVNKTVAIKTVILDMTNSDKGAVGVQNILRPFNYSSSSVPITTEFLQNWACVAPNVNVNVSSNIQVMTAGVSITLVPQVPLQIAQSCCLSNQECLCLQSYNLPPPAICSLDCLECQFTTPAAIAGWVVGGTLLFVILLLACTSLILDCKNVCACNE